MYVNSKLKKEMKLLYTKPATEILAKDVECPFCAGSVNTKRTSDLGTGNFSGYEQPGQIIGEDNGDQSSRGKGNNFWDDEN